MLRLTVRKYLVLQNICRCRQGVT